MKVRTLIIVTMVIVVMALGAGVIAQSTDEESRDALRKYLEQLGMKRIDPPSVEAGGWKLISQECGVLLREDSDGVLRGRMYVLRDGRWVPVAVDGFSEVAPQDMLLQRQGF
jgi:hypothetical protein